jgi:hypothetical protein
MYVPCSTLNSTIGQQTDDTIQSQTLKSERVNALTDVPSMRGRVQSEIEPEPTVNMAPKTWGSTTQLLLLVQ